MGVGIVAGIVLGEFLGRVDTDRLRATVRRLRRPVGKLPPGDLEAIRRDVSGALNENPKTRALQVDVRALGDGVVELTGEAPDREARELAGTIARGVAGTHVVVNRMRVEEAAPPEPRSRSTAG